MARDPLVVKKGKMTVQHCTKPENIVFVLARDNKPLCIKVMFSKEQLQWAPA